MELEITTLADRPELRDPMRQMSDTWPEYIQNDPVGSSHFGRIATELPEYVLVATDETGELVARALSVPFALRADDRDGELPDGGWDQVLVWAFADRRRGTEPDTVSAIEIAVATAHQGSGISAAMLGAMRESARTRGFSEVVAPVRPSAKHREPKTSIHAYARRIRPEDGLPHDPWLRVHVRAGGVIEKVATTSMCVAASVEQWQSWTGLPFDEPGGVEVPGALVPVHCDPDRGYAVYVEPNVWVRHAV